MEIQGHHAYYRTPDNELWRVDLNELALGDRWTVEIALKNPGAVTFWNTLDGVKNLNPNAFNLVPDGAGTLPIPDFSLATSFPFDVADMDVNFLVALVVNLFLELGGDIRKNALEASFQDIVDNMKEALNRLKTEEKAAMMEFIGAVVAASLSAATGVAGIIGGAKSMRDSTRDVADRTKLSAQQEKVSARLENAEGNAADYRQSAKDMRSVAEASRTKADEAGAKAKKHDAEAEEHLKTAAAKSKELDQIRHPPLSSADKAKLRQEIDAATTDAVKAKADAKAARQEQDMHLKEAKEADDSAMALTALADKERDRAASLRSELTQINRDIKVKDDEIAENANFTRLISVVAPIFTSLGQMAAAFPNLDSKTLTAYANYMTALISGNEMEKSVQDEIAKNFLEFIHSLVDWMKSIAESNNQTLSTSARAMA